jgi:hypothetical protein
MLRIEIPISPEGWDEVKQEFVEPKTQVLQLEHSLVSLSKWESKWCKPYLTQEVKTPEETIDYIRCMTITQNVDPDVYNHVTNANIEQVNEYINAKMTATWFAEDKKKKKKARNSRPITNELIYYWMISFGIPFKCEKWHLNRLLTLIEVCEREANPRKGPGMKESIVSYAERNAARKAKLKSKG